MHFCSVMRMNLNMRRIGIGVAVITFIPLGALAVTLSGNVKFFGNLSITGALSKGSGTFIIDHPLDPSHRLLVHSFVESPDAKNFYDGTAVLDENGEVRISVPDYFMALNKDFRYQLFPHHEPMPQLHIGVEVADNTFTITGGAPRGTVSWSITGIRHDPYILEYPIIVEVPKTQETIVPKGSCLFEPLCR